MPCNVGQCRIFLFVLVPYSKNKHTDRRSLSFSAFCAFLTFCFKVIQFLHILPLWNAFSSQYGQRNSSRVNKILSSISQTPMFDFQLSEENFIKMKFCASPFLSNSSLFERFVGIIWTFSLNWQTKTSS